MIINRGVHSLFWASFLVSLKGHKSFFGGGIWRFIALSTRSHHWFLSWVSWIPLHIQKIFSLMCKSFIKNYRPSWNVVVTGRVFLVSFYANALWCRSQYRAAEVWSHGGIKGWRNGIFLYVELRGTTSFSRPDYQPVSQWLLCLTVILYRNFKYYYRLFLHNVSHSH